MNGDWLVIVQPARHGPYSLRCNTQSAAEEIVRWLTIDFSEIAARAIHDPKRSDPL